MILVNNEIFRVACQGILIKTIYLLSDVLLLFKVFFTARYNDFFQPIMALFRSDIIDS